MRIFWILLLISGTAHAELAVDIHGLSKHINADKEYNETNPGLGLAYGYEHVKAVAGFYKNSLSERTTYIGAELMSSGFFRIGLMAGIAHGKMAVGYGDYIGTEVEDIGGAVVFTPVYDETKETVTRAVGVPVIEIGSGAAVRFMLAPKQSRTPAVVAASARVYF